MMSNKFCRYLSNGYSFFIDDRDQVMVNPCCWFKSPIPLNQHIFKNRKEKFESIETWTSDCDRCFYLEKSGQQSLRQTANDWIPELNSQDPVTVDIHLDNDCNAACVTCNENSSSLWFKEKLKNNIKPIKIFNQANNIHDKITDISRLISFDNLSYVKFFGGEPLFTDSHLQFIEKIPHPENVTLHYTTNGSIHPNQETLELWKKFKVIIFAVSIDGVGKQFDYIRWPLKWDKVENNLRRLQTNKDIKNLMFRVEFTANFLNSYYFDTVESWVNTNLLTNSSGDKTEINIHPYHGNTWNLSKMPTKLRQMVLEKFHETHTIHQMVKQLPEPDNLDTWHDFVETWDLRRKNNWRNAFFELSDTIKN